MFLCADCKLVRYCSRECQKHSWQRHKQMCHESLVKTRPLSQQEAEEFGHAQSMYAIVLATDEWFPRAHERLRMSLKKQDILAVLMPRRLIDSDDNRFKLVTMKGITPSDVLDHFVVEGQILLRPSEVSILMICSDPAVLQKLDNIYADIEKFWGPKVLLRVRKAIESDKEQPEWFVVMNVEQKD